MPTSRDKFSTGYEGGKGSNARRAKERAVERNPPTSTPAAAERAAEEATVATVTPSGTYVPGPAAPSASVGSKSARRAAKAKEKRRYRKRLERVTRIKDALDFDRDRRAKSYEEDKIAELGAKFFEHNPDGTIKTKTVEVPVIKTSEKKIAADKLKYGERIREAGQSGLSPKAIHLLAAEAHNRVINDNYSIGHNGKVATVPDTIPALKPEMRQKFNKELAHVKKKVHQIREGQDSYHFQSDVGKAQEQQIAGALYERKHKGDHGLLGDIYGTVANAPGIKQARQFFDPTHAQSGERTAEGIASDISAIGTGIHAVNSLFSGGQVQLQDAGTRASGVPGFQDLPDIRQDVLHGLHVGTTVGGEYLTRPGLVIEQGLAAATGAKHSSGLEALLHGHNAKNVATGKEISERVFGNPIWGLPIDFLTDPTLWVGLGEIRASEGEQIVAATERMAKSGVPVSSIPGLASDVLKASDTGEVGNVLDRLRQVAKDENVDLGGLGKTKEDKAAIKDWKQRVNAKQERRIMRDRKARQESKDRFGTEDQYLGGASRKEAAVEAGRREAEKAKAPGLRVNIQTPLGREIGGVDIKLPKAARKAKIIPDIGKARDRTLKLREDRAVAGVMKKYDADLTDATSALKKAGPGAAREAAETRLKGLLDEIDVAKGEAIGKISKAPRRSAEESAQITNVKRVAHQINRVANANSRAVLHRMLTGVAETFKKLDKGEREQVGLHMREYANNGGREVMSSIAPLNAKQEAALDAYKNFNYEMGRHGLESGTMDALTHDYMFRAFTEGTDATGLGLKRDEATKAAERSADNSNPQKSRGFASSFEATGRNRLAEQLQKAKPSLTREEALAYADRMHENGKLRTVKEDLMHAVQRGHVIHEDDMTPYQREAYEFDRERQKSTKVDTPPVFQDLEKTEGILKLNPEGTKHLPDDAFGHLNEKDAQALRRTTAASDLDRLKAFRETVDRPDLQDDLDRVIAQREEELSTYRTPYEKGSKTKLNNKVDKLEELYARPGTEGEKAAAKEKLDEVKKRIKKMGETPVDEFIPGEASREYLKSLTDFRDSHRNQFEILDPMSGAYHQATKEAVSSAYHNRWNAVDELYGRDMTDKNLRRAGGGDEGEPIYYDKHTGEEYVRYDPAVFGEVLGEHRVIPARVHSDIRSEFFRMGENIQKQIHDDVVASWYRKFASLTRYSLTTYFPAYHARNMISDLFNSVLADPSVLFHPVMNAKIGESSMLGGTKLDRNAKIDVPGFEKPIASEDYLFFMDTLGLSTQQQVAEFMTMVDRGEVIDKSWWQKLNPGPTGRVGQAAHGISARIQDARRVKTFTQRMRRNGGDAADAAWYTIKHHFDYGDLNHKEKTFWRNLFLFYTWYRKNIPLQLLSVAQKPGFFSALTNTQIELAEGATPMNIDWSKISPLLPDMSGPVANSALIPDYMLDEMGTFITNINGNTTAFSLGLPQGDLNMAFSAVTKPGEGLLQLASMLSPVPRLGIEAAAQRNLLTGQALEGYENSTPADLLSQLGISSGVDSSGRPVLPWYTNMILSNVFPALGRGGGYLKPPSEVENQTTFSKLFGGGFGSALTGVTAYNGPEQGSEAEKRAFIYKAYELVDPIKTISNNGKDGKTQQAEVKAYEEKLPELAAKKGVPFKYVQSVSGSKYYISASDRQSTEAPLLGGSSSNPLAGSSKLPSLLGGESSSGLPTPSPAPVPTFENGTEKALWNLKENAQGFNLPAAQSRASESDVEKAVQNLVATEAHDARAALPKEPTLGQRLQHQGRLPNYAEAKPEPGPRAESRKAPTSLTVKKAQDDVTKRIAKAAVPNDAAKEKVTGTHSVEWYRKHPGKENSGDLNFWKAHPVDQDGKPAKTLTVPAISGLPDQDATQFAEALAHYTGMSPEIAGAWTLSEMGGEASGGGAGKYNYLGVGFPGEKTALSEEVPSSSPEAAAKFTAEWLKGTYSGPHPAGGGETGKGINEILSKSNGGKNPQKFVQALGESGWGTVPEHVAENLGAVSVDGKTTLNGDTGDFKIIRSRQQARTVIHLANKFSGTQEGSKLQAHWAAMSGISSSEAWCSAFISTLMRRVGLPEPSAPAAAGTWQNWKGGKRLSTTDPEALHPGDIITFGSGDPAGDYADHVGLYVGDGEMISGNFGDEVRRGPLTEESRPIQAIVRPHYSGKEVAFKISATPTLASGSEAASGAPVASGSPSTASAEAISGAAAQSTPGYHPGRTKQAQISAAQMRSNVLKGLSGTSSEVKSRKIGGYGKNVLTTAAKARAEVERLNKGDTSLTAATKRKPVFRR